MAYKKKQHYVPQVYLQSWTTGGELFTMRRQGGGLVRNQPPKSVANRNHLYTLPATFFGKDANSNPDLRELITDTVVMGTWEGRWQKVRTCLSLYQDLTPILHTIKGFVISQSLRTPKFLRLNKETIESAGKSLDVEDAFQFAVVGMRGLTALIENCVVEIFQHRDIQNFITCDNPATHWIQEGSNYRHLGGIALNPDLHGNPHYKILCPLHPKTFAILSPNLGIKKSEANKNKVWLRPCHVDLVNRFNLMVEEGADEMLFAKQVADLI